MTAKDILNRLYHIGAYNDILIPEFTFEGRRIDALIVNCRDRKVRGYEIKVSRADFLQDKKWKEYAAFCNLLYLVCPKGLIKPEEVEPPFGLIYIGDSIYNSDYSYVKRARPIDHSKNNGFEQTYIKILEYELPRIHFESTCVKCRAERTS